MPRQEAKLESIPLGNGTVAHIDWVVTNDRAQVRLTLEVPPKKNGFKGWRTFALLDAQALGSLQKALARAEVYVDKADDGHQRRLSKSKCPKSKM